MSRAEVIAGLGRAGDKVASAPQAVLSRISLSDDECQVLAVIGRSAKIEDVLDRCGLAETQALNALLMLRAKGAVLPVKRKKKTAASPSPPTATRAAESATEAGEAAPAIEDSQDAIAAARARERRERLARHPYLARIKRQYRPS